MAKKKKTNKKTGSSKKRKIDKTQIADYDYHLSVLLKECVDFLVTDPNGVYADGTLGGGGHAAVITQRLNSGGNLLAFDKDEESISHCLVKFKEELDKGDSSRIILVNESFESACRHERLIGKAKGLLLDLGVSSRQFDSDSQGFSYRVETDLDMRFSHQGESAEALLNAAREEELANIIWEYGEEPNSRKIAKRIIEARRIKPLKTTFDLKQIIEECIPPRFHIKVLSRVFQALRIHVNDELGTLKRTLAGFLPIMDIGGRFVIMSYHSLEDRIVKNFFRDNAINKMERRQLERGEKLDSPRLEIITKKPILPNEEEMLRNPRARSAKLRVAERIA